MGLRPKPQVKQKGWIDNLYKLKNTNEQKEDGTQTPVLINDKKAGQNSR